MFQNNKKRIFRWLYIYSSCTIIYKFSLYAYIVFYLFVVTFELTLAIIKLNCFCFSLFIIISLLLLFVFAFSIFCTENSAHNTFFRAARSLLSAVWLWLYALVCVRVYQHITSCLRVCILFFFLSARSSCLVYYYFFSYLFYCRLYCVCVCNYYPIFM